MFNPVRLLQTWKWPDLFLLHAGRITAIVPPRSVFTEISFCPEQRWRLYCELNVWHCKEQEAASPALKSKHWLQISAGRCSEMAYEQGRKLCLLPLVTLYPQMNSGRRYLNQYLVKKYWDFLHLTPAAPAPFLPSLIHSPLLAPITLWKSCVSRDKTGVNQHCLEEPEGDYTYWSWGHLFAKGAYRQNMARSWVACYRKC